MIPTAYLGVANGPPKSIGLPNVSSNFKVPAVSCIQRLSVSHSLEIPICLFSFLKNEV